MSRARSAALGSLLLALAIGCRSPARQHAPAGAPLGFAPQSALFELAAGGEATEDFRLTGPAEGAVLSVVSGGDPDLRITPLPAEKGANPGLRIHVSGRTMGVRAGSLLVATGLDRPRQVPLLFSLRVRGALRISPTNPIIDLSGPGPKRTFIDVTSAREDLVVTAAQIEKGPFTASFEPAATSRGYRVTVSAVTEKIAGGTRGAVGTLVVLSNDAAEPRKEIPLFAFGAVGDDRPESSEHR